MCVFLSYVSAQVVYFCTFVSNPAVGFFVCHTIQSVSVFPVNSRGINYVVIPYIIIYIFGCTQLLILLDLPDSMLHLTF